MEISLVCVEDALLNIGFRKLAAYVKKELRYDASIYYAAHGDSWRSYSNMILGKIGNPVGEDDEEQARRMAEPIADADIVAFSSMSPYAPLTRRIIKHVRQVNPDAYVIWGGIHPIIQPEDAIQHADAICTGEGEYAFEEFLAKYEAGRDYTDTKNFWFKENGEVVRNDHRPLMTEEQMDDLPLLQYGEEERIFRGREGYVPLSPKIYREFNGLGYNTIWSIGCPLHCTFCGNTKFIENHSKYTQVRHPSPSYIVDEIEQALEVHPYVSTVIFHDDSFMALHPDTLRDFADEYKRRLDLPFTVMGVIPNYVTEERMEILLDAGMHRLRMGIQNGSEEILEFYKRPAPPKRVRKAARILNKYQDYMMPPTYDVIVDNPVETTKNVRENVDLFRDLPRPYYLNLFSLRVIPNTELEEQLDERNLSICDISENSFNDCSPTVANSLLYLVSTFPLPDWLYETLLERSKPAEEDQTFRPGFLILCRMLHLLHIARFHLRHFEFSIIGKQVGYFLWKLGILDAWRKHFTPEFDLDRDGQPEHRERSRDPDVTPSPAQTLQAPKQETVPEKAL